jgi:hypothetical protein
MSNELALSEKEINELRAARFYVERAADTDGAGWVWASKDGASQLVDTPQQPPRRTAAQAWYDCAQYYAGAVSTKTEPDWVQS